MYNTSIEMIPEKYCLQKAYKQEGLGFDFKHVAPDVPQQNCCIERKFAALFEKFNA